MKKQTKIALLVLSLVAVSVVLFSYTQSSVVKGKADVANSACVPATVVYSSDTKKTGATKVLYKSFNDFAAAVKNQTLPDCNYNIQAGNFNASSLADQMLAKCSKAEFYAFIDQAPMTVSCSKQVDDNFYRFDLYQKYANMQYSMDAMDDDYFELSTYKAYRPFEVRIGD